MFNRKVKLASARGALFIVRQQTDIIPGLFVQKLQILASFLRNKPETMKKDW